MGDSVAVTNEREDRIFEELHRIRQDIQALRRAFEQQGVKEEFNRRLSELEVEQRLYQIEQELTADGTSKRKRRPWRRT